MHPDSPLRFWLYINLLFAYLLIYCGWCEQWSTVNALIRRQRQIRQVFHVSSSTSLTAHVCHVPQVAAPVSLPPTMSATPAPSALKATSTSLTRGQL